MHAPRAEAARMLVDASSPLSTEAQVQLLMGLPLGPEARGTVEALQRDWAVVLQRNATQESELLDQAWQALKGAIERPGREVDWAAVEKLPLAERLFELAPLLVHGEQDERARHRRVFELLAFYVAVPGLRPGMVTFVAVPNDGAMREMMTAPSTPSRPRKTWPRLEAPEKVPVEELFEVTVGLSPQPLPGVGGTGALWVPDQDFVLDLELRFHGFTLHDGPPRRSLQVTEAEPFPSTIWRISADVGDELKDVREIGCTFFVNGVLCGYASWLIAVRGAARDPPVPEQPEMPLAPLDLGDARAEEAPDLTIVITAGSDVAGTKLVWTAYSRHLDVPRDLPPTDVGQSPEAFTANLISTGSVAAADATGFFDHLIGSGLSLADQMPEEIRKALRELETAVGIPHVLIATSDPYLPWELAVIDESVHHEHEEESPFLGGRMAIGRWPLTGRQPPPTPPASITVDDRVVVCGSYQDVKGAGLLQAAEEEGEELVSLWTGAKQVEPVPDDVRRLLNGEPDADLLHFALHGQFSESTRNGLVLVETESEKGQRIAYYMQPQQIQAGRLHRRPFVFLNACQVGAGTKVLGDHAGLAAALLRIGASAVVAPLWSIDDRVARDIARDFYAATVDAPDGGLGVAEALRRQRARLTPAVVAAGDGHGASTHLAFQYFGHPRLTLRPSAN